MQASVLNGRERVARAHPADTLAGGGFGEGGGGVGGRVFTQCARPWLSRIGEPQCRKVWMSLWRLTEGLEGPLRVGQLVLQLQRWIHMTFL